MKWTNVESSHLLGIAYDKKKTTLYIEFKGTVIYSYTGVHINVYRSFCKAESKGKFFHSEIKPTYQCTKLDLATRKDLSNKQLAFRWS